MKIRVKKLHEDAIIPKYQTYGASGFDLHALEDIEIAAGETKLVKTGLAIDVGPGYELQIRSRSGMSLKTPLRVANSPGTIDSDFRGQICVIMWNSAAPFHLPNGNLTTRFTVWIKKGDRIAQGVICPVVRADIEEVNFLDETDRGSGGFGSTGV
jgi:dUTP pyrophosphatase